MRGLRTLSRFLAAANFFFVRLVIILGTLGTIVFAHLIGGIAAQLGKGRPWGSVAYPFAYLLTLASFPVFRLFTNGLETGLYVLTLALLVLTEISSSSLPGERRPRILLGALIGITALARIDFLVVITCWGILRLLKDRRKAVPELASMALVAAIIVAPWFLWVYSQSGHWMPQSGPVESRWMTLADAPDRLASATAAVIQHLVPIVYSTYDLWHNTLKARAFTLFSGVLLVTFLIWARPGRLLREFGGSAEWRSLGLWLLSICSLVLVYPVIFWATGFYFRYLAPLLVCMLPLLALACARRLGAGTSPVTARTLGLSSLFLFLAAAVFTLHSGRVENPQSITAGYIRSYYPTAKVATFQSGIIGFFNENTRNLDGKMDLAALKARQQGRIEEYIDQIGHEVIVDWGNSYIRRILSSKWLETKWKPCEIDVPDGRTLCFVRLSPTGKAVVSAEGPAAK